MVTDSNLLFYKECIKLLMILGAMMIIFALSRNEGRETEIIRNKATRNAIFLTVLFCLADALSGSNRRYHDRRYLFFSYFLIINVLCLEFGMQKARIDKIFKR